MPYFRGVIPRKLGLFLLGGIHLGEEGVGPFRESPWDFVVSERAEAKIWLAEAPVPLAALVTPPILADSSCDPLAAPSTFRAISWVAEPRSSTAAAMVAEIWSISPMIFPIAPIARTASWVAPA